MRENELFCANAGDSRAIMGVKGRAEDLSEDHKPALEGERARIYKAGSTITPEGRVDGNLNLSRAIGDLRYKKNKALKPEEHPVTAFPDVLRVDRSPDQDFLIIACDGIWETKSSQDVVDYVYEQKRAGVENGLIVSNLLDSILSPNIEETEGKGCDNMTCMIVDLKQ